MEVANPAPQQNIDQRLLDQRKQISSIYHNMQQIFSYPGTSIDRIRNTDLNSSYGLSTDLSTVLTEIYKDDVMQPKPSAMLRLQDFTIKTWFSSTRLNIMRDPVAQSNILDLMLSTNERILDEWNRLLEFVHTKKQVISTDLLRYVSLIISFN